MVATHVEFNFATQLEAALVVMFGFIRWHEQNDPSNKLKWRSRDVSARQAPPPRMINARKLGRWAAQHNLAIINNPTTAQYWSAVYNHYSDEALQFVLDTILANEPRDVAKYFSLRVLYEPGALKNCIDAAEQIFYLKRIVEEARAGRKLLKTSIGDCIATIWSPVWRQLQKFKVNTILRTQYCLLMICYCVGCCSRIQSEVGC